MNPGELELIADTLLVNKLANIEYSLLKTAGFGDLLIGKLGEGLNVIKEEVLGTVDTSSVGSATSDIGNMIATGALFKIWWPLAFINGIASQVYGINIITIGKQIWDLIVGKITSQGSISPQDVSEATKSVTLAMAGSDNQPVADRRAFDLFEPLRTADLNGELYKFARTGRSRNGGAMGFFQSISPFKGKTIIGGLVGWVIKAALIGAGILTVSGVGARLLGLKKSPEEAAQAPDETQESGAGYTEQEEAPSVGLTPTGRGQDIHQNDHSKSQWVVPLVQNSVEKTLIVWAGDVYEELAGQDQAIRQSASFNKVVNEMKRLLEYGNTSRVPVPPQYKSRKQVVDQFARDVASKLNPTG